MDCKVVEQIDLTTKSKQISIGVLESGHVCLLYVGSKLPANTDLSYMIKDINRASYLSDTDGIKDFRLEQLPLLYPSFGNPDLREPAFHLTYENGSRISNFRFLKVERFAGKKKLLGLPSTFSKGNVETIELILEDTVVESEIRITLSGFKEYDVFTQSVKLVNHSSEKIVIDKMMSLDLDLLDDRFDLLSLSGAWGRETQISREKLHAGFQGLDSKRGASGHGQNPFMALVRPETDDNSGEVIAVNLIYSGSFLAEASVDMHQNTRMQIGINPFDFQWSVAPSESFQSPEVVIVHTDQGLNDMTHKFHRFYLDCLIQPTFSRQPRPVLLNNWEATYFDFNRTKLLELAKCAADCGIELFVLDDGWFGERNSVEGSVGDWVPNEKKLGGQLSGLIKEINSLGLSFGLWIEPEMVSPNSELFRHHPDWIIQVPDRKPQLSRLQYVLDLSRIDVQDYIIASIKTLLKNNSIDYLKWDMNRNITDSGSQNLLPLQQELGHRYILGLYRILEEITSSYPKVLIESCAGGGGRFDPGMLAYTPQIWPSDDTDAIERLSIQEGTSLIYPNVSMGCHVSAVPNHQVGRLTSLNTRAQVAFQGNLGYELDLTVLKSQEKQMIAQQIAHYKHYRKTLQFGHYSRIDTHDNNSSAWTKQDSKYLIVTYIEILSKPNTVPKRLKLTDLEIDKTYKLETEEKQYSSAELMNIGLPLPRFKEDFSAKEWIFLKVQD